MSKKGKNASSRALPGEHPFGSPQKPAFAKRRRQNEIRLTLRNVMILAVVGIIVVVGLVALSNSNPNIGFSPTAAPPTDGGSVVQIQTSGISTTATFYNYNSNGVNVRYFIVRDGSNQIRLATDACDVCWAAKRGYRQTGLVMTCNNCGQTFTISSLGASNTGGGCWPGYLPYSINGAYVEISKASLDGKRSKFA